MEFRENAAIGREERVPTRKSRKLIQALETLWYQQVDGSDAKLSLVLKDGTIIENAKILEQPTDIIRIQVGDQARTIAVDDISIPTPNLDKFFKSLDRGASRYEQVIKNEHEHTKTTVGTPFSQYTRELFEDLKKADSPEARESLQYLTDKIKDHDLIDLGGSTGGYIRPLAKELGARTYITVDRFFSRRRNEDSPVYDLPLDPYTNIGTEIWSELPEQLSGKGRTESAAVKADMLDFVSRLPDNSANFTLNGIDSAIVSRPDDIMSADRNTEYEEAVVKEIIRATKKGGIIFGCDIPFIVGALENNPAFKRYEPALQVAEEVYIYEKMA